MSWLDRLQRTLRRLLPSLFVRVRAKDIGRASEELQGREGREPSPAEREAARRAIEAARRRGPGQAP